MSIKKLSFVDNKSINAIALGGAVLGSGGGGDPYVGRLMTQQSMKESGGVEVIDIESLPDDALILPIAMMGAPTVMVELNVLFGKADMRTESEASVARLGSVYWYIMEFGACRENGIVKSVGPGLLSSFGEMEHACSEGEGCGDDEACVCNPKIKYLEPNFEEMETRPYDVTKYQPVLYVWDSFEEMYAKTKEFVLNWGTDDDPRKDLHK